MAANKPFKFTDMVVAFQAVSTKTKATGTVDIPSFLAAFCEVRKVFGVLGKVFNFAFADLDDKMKIVTAANAANPALDTVFKMVAVDVASGNIPPKEGPGTSLTRSLNRMAHVMLFVQRMMEKLFTSKDEISTILRAVYPDSLGRIHTWLVQKAVGAAFSAAPSRVKFTEGLGCTEDEFMAQSLEYIECSKVVFAQVEKDYVDQKVPMVFK